MILKVSAKIHLQLPIRFSGVYSRDFTNLDSRTWHLNRQKLGDEYILEVYSINSEDENISSDSVEVAFFPNPKVSNIKDFENKIKRSIESKYPNHDWKILYTKPSEIMIQSNFKTDAGENVTSFSKAVIQIMSAFMLFTELFNILFLKKRKI